MVLVKVDGKIYTLSDIDICGSKTIELLLDTCQSDEHTPITLDVLFSCQDWREYLNFLKSDEVVIVLSSLDKLNKYTTPYEISKTSITTLKIIDYLDNLQQGIRWCKLEYERYEKFKQVCDHNDSSDSDDSADSIDNGDYEDRRRTIHWNKIIIRDILVNVINNNTVFNPCQLLPTQLIIRFEDILSIIKILGDSEITTTFAKHIVDNLFAEHISWYYHQTCYKFNMSDISKYSIQDLESRKFIFKPTTTITNPTTNPIPPQTADHIVDNNKVLYKHMSPYHRSDYSSYQILLQQCDAKFISLRVAKYYPNIIVHPIRDCYLLCPNDKPYIQKQCSEAQISSDTVINVISVTCHDQPSLSSPLSQKQLSKQQKKDSILSHDESHKPLNTLFCPNNKYKPRDGFQTGTKIKNQPQNSNINTNCDTNYDLLSYNKPSTYNRDYYMFLPYEYDPIAKVVYAFSV